MSSPPPDWFEQGWPHVWLPYCQMKTAAPPLPVVGAECCEIILADGRRLLDGTASWWSMCHGYQHPHLVKAIQDQAATLSHVMFGGLAHEPAYRLAQRLCAIAPKGLTRAFFVDSGSIAVEVALKMALQYWRNKGKPRKGKFICFSHAYHGDTFGTMSVSARGGMHAAFDGLASKHYHMDIPSDEYSVAEFEETVAAIADGVAGLIIEPLVQGAGGLRFHSADVLAEIRRVCREHDVLFIADEVMTGFGRTGNLFACNEAGIAPDILCVGKALTGGHIGMAATLASEAVFEAFLNDDASHALMHGPTFMANPLACAAANASLDLFEQVDYLSRIEQIEMQLEHGLRGCVGLDGVLDVRVKGAIGVVQIDAAAADIAALKLAFIEQGVWLRPFGDVIYLMPPLVVSDEQLQRLIEAVCRVMLDWSERRIDQASS